MLRFKYILVAVGLAQLETPPPPDLASTAPLCTGLPRLHSQQICRGEVLVAY